MFSFHNLEVVHWDYWRRFGIPLDAGIVTVVGPNGSGKTTLLDALRTLLVIGCSSGRDYKRYVRRSDAPYAWLRAEVSNPRRPNGQLAFWPITDERVTLFCQIRKKGGDWERRYGIAPGSVSVEDAETSERIVWKAVRQYESELEHAGLTRAIKRVLALDQGHTDKLCEYSGRQLLELVFNVFGDQEVLDNYQAAKQEQLAVERELEVLKTRLAQLGTQLREAEAEVNSFNEWMRLTRELADLQAEWLPRVTVAELLGGVRAGRSQLQGARRERVRLSHDYGEAQRRHAELDAAADQAERDTEAAIGDESRAQDAFIAARSDAGAIDKTLESRERLLSMAREQAAGIDVEKASAQFDAAQQERFSLTRRQDELAQNISELKARIVALESGRSLAPREVEQFRSALTDAGIAHCGLAEIVQISDPAWQGAVEAVLRGLRHVVLLDDPDDRARAWRLGEQLRFRHYVVPDRERAPPATAGSLGACVRFTAKPPVWLPRMLNDIQCVRDVAEGATLPARQSWITPQAYHRERRGARDVSVDDFYFGRAAAAPMKQRMTQLQAEHDAVQPALEKTLKRIADLQMLIAGVDAARELAARQAEFADAETRGPQCAARAQAAAEALADAQMRRREAGLRAQAVREQRGELSARLKQMEAAIQRLCISVGNSREEQVRRIVELRKQRLRLPAEKRTADALDEARRKFESVHEVEREIGRERTRLEEGRFVRDDSCIARHEKLAREHEQLAGTIDNQYVHLDRARIATQRARGSYINVLKGTIRRYAQNLRTLGELAGIAVEVEHPQLANDDAQLAQAALAVRFNFDQKGMIGLNDGEASGGQQVMKSMILLVSLLMDEDAGGGFVFIDEPFAHLDIFNIDKVGGFLEATRAQYILTTPNTHNVNVYKPSDLTLVTQKRRPGEQWAPPVAFLRRDRSGAAAA